MQISISVDLITEVLFLAGLEGLWIYRLGVANAVTEASLLMLRRFLVTAVMSGAYAQSNRA